MNGMGWGGNIPEFSRAPGQDVSSAGIASKLPSADQTPLLAMAWM